MAAPHIFLFDYYPLQYFTESPHQVTKSTQDLLLLCLNAQPAHTLSIQHPFYGM